MVRNLRSWPGFAITFVALFAASHLQAKPPELPAKPKDECVIPAVFDPQKWDIPLLIVPSQFEFEESLQPEKPCMPAEIEVLTIPPHEVPVPPTTLRLPSLPPIDAGLILALEKVEAELEAKDMAQFGIITKLMGRVDRKNYICYP
jgi:hypothetical protein